VGALSAAAATVGAVQLTARPLKALLCAIAATTQNPHGQQDQALAFVQQQQQQRAQRRQRRQGGRGTAVVLAPSSSASPALLRAPAGAAPARAAPVPAGPLGLLGAALHCSLL
jgi:hypothetical protein